MAETDPREFHHQPPPPQQQLQQQQQHPGMHHDHYSHYHVEEQSPPHVQHPPHHLHQHHHHQDGDQPLDLSLPSRSPRPSSAGVTPPPPGAKRPRIEEPAGPGGGQRSGGVCIVKGCGCQNALPLHHPHHAARLQRHSPYPLPQQYSPPHGHRSPGLSEAQHHPHHPYPYPLHQYPAVSSSQSLMRGASPYRYSPESHDLHSRSPYGPGVIVSSSSSLSPYSGEMGRGPHPHSPSSGFLGLPPHTSASPLSVSPRPAQRDLSPRPHSNQISPRSRDVSPRPLYRPYEDVGRSPVEATPVEASPVAPVISSSSGGVIPRQDGFRSTSDADLSASSSLLLLSNTASAIANISTPPAQPNYPDGAWQERENSRYGRAGGEVQQRHSPMEEDRDHHEVPSPMAGEHRRASAFQQQSHVHNSMPPHPCGPAPLHHAFTRPGVHGFGDHDPNSVKPGDADSTHENQANDKLSGSQTERSLPPPSAAAQQRPPFPDLITSSSKPSGAGEREEEPRRFVKIKDTTALAELRARREKEAAEKAQTRKRQALFNPADRENTSDSSSSGDGSDSSDYIDGSIKPPDPNLKMSPLDYLISEVLVKRIDIPFKPCNTEIKKNFRLNKGKLRLVDLIELQVEQSLKA